MAMDSSSISYETMVEYILVGPPTELRTPAAGLLEQLVIVTAETVRHCLVFPLHVWPRHRLCPVCSTAVRG